MKSRIGKGSADACFATQPSAELLQSISSGEHQRWSIHFVSSPNTEQAAVTPGFNVLLCPQSEVYKKERCDDRVVETISKLSFHRTLRPHEMQVLRFVNV